MSERRLDDAINALDQLTFAEIAAADSAALDRLRNAAWHWWNIADNETRRRKDTPLPVASAYARSWRKV